MEPTHHSTGLESKGTVDANTEVICQSETAVDTDVISRGCNASGHFNSSFRALLWSVGLVTSALQQERAGKTHWHCS